MKKRLSTLALGLGLCGVALAWQPHWTTKVSTWMQELKSPPTEKAEFAAPQPTSLLSIQQTKRLAGPNGKPLPVPVMAMGATTICEGDSVELAAPTGYDNYLWSNGANTRTIWVKTSGNYTVQVGYAGGPLSDTLAGFTDSGVTLYPAGAVDTDSVWLFVNTRGTCPTGNGGLTGAIEVRMHAGVRIGGNNFQNVIRADDNNPTSPTRFSPMGNGWWVKGFRTTDYFTTTPGQADALTYVLTGDAQNGGWFPKEGKRNGAGCEDFVMPFPVQASAGASPFGVAVNVTPAPTTPVLTAMGATTFCTGGSVVLRASGGTSGSYTWSNGATTDSIVVTTPGTYTVRSGAGSCVSAASNAAVVSVTSKPLPVAVTAMGATTICQGDSVMLSAPAGYAEYLWSNGATTQTIWAKAAGSYSVRVASVAGGCLSDTLGGFFRSGVLVYPAGATADDSIYLYLNANQTCPLAPAGNSLAGANVVRLHGGVTLGGNAFSNVQNTTDPAVEPRTRFMMGNGMWMKAIQPRSYFGLTAGQNPTALDFVLNGGAPVGGWFEREGKDGTAGCNDFKVNLPVPLTSMASPFAVQVQFSTPAAAPTVTASGPLAFCQGGRVVLRASGAASGSYTWSNGATSDTLLVTTSGTFSVVTGTGACASTSSMPVTVTVTPNSLPKPSLMVSSGSLTGCAGSAVVLDAGAQPTGIGYRWSTGDTTQTITITRSGIYSVALTQGGCVGPDSALTAALQARPMPVMVSASGALNFCEGDSVTLSAPAGFSAYLWSNGATTQSIVAKTAGRYTVRVANSNGCFSDTLAGMSRPGVFVYPANATENDSVFILVNPTQTCPNPSVNNLVSLAGANVVRLHSGATVNGQAWQGVVNSTDPAVEPSTRFTRMGDWWVKGIVPRTYYGMQGGYQGLNFVLNGGAPVGGWFEREGKDEANNCDNYFIALPVPGLALASPFGVTVGVQPRPATPSITTTDATTFCFGKQAVLRATGGTPGSYRWNTGVRADTLVVTTSGSYTVQSINGTCLSMPSAATVVDVTETAGISIMAMGNTSFCTGDSVVLMADTLLDPTQSYRWSNGATTRSITVRMSGDYSVRVFGADGCGSAASNMVAVTVANRPLPVPVMANGPTSFCAGESVTLSAPTGFNFYRWSNGETTREIVATTAGRYTVTVANVQGCFSDTLSGSMISGVMVAPAGATSADSIMLMVNTSATCPLPSANPAVSLEGANIVRLHSGATMGANPWQNVVSTTDVNVEPSTRFSPMGNMWVKTLVPNEYYRLSGISGMNFVLNGGPAQGGWFAKEGKVEPGCGDFSITFPIQRQAMATPYGVTVTINTTPAAPVVTASGDTNFCLGNSVVLRAAGGVSGSYVWSNNSTADTLLVTQAGAYSVRSVAGACSSAVSNVINVTVTTTAAPSVSVVGDSTVCQGQLVVLTTPEVLGARYLWNNGDTNRTISVARSGRYNVRVFSNGCGTDSSRSVQVTITPRPLPVPAMAMGGTSICAGDSVQLTAPSGFSSYLWSNGANTQNIWVRTSGHYTVRVANANGCFSDTLGGFNISGVTVYPAGATADDSIFLFLDPRLTCPLPAANAAQSLSAAGIVRMHSGANINGSRWSNVVNTTDPVAELRTRFTAINNVWVKALTPRTYYGAAATANVSELCFVLNGGAPVGGWFEREGKVQPGCQDFFVPLPIQASAMASPFGVTITVNGPLAAPTVTPAGPAQVCDNGTLTLTADLVGARYIWSNGDTTRSITVRTANSYTLRVIQGSCTSATSAPVQVSVIPAPVATATFRNDSLIATAPGTSFQWLLNGLPILGAQANFFRPTTDGNYQVIISNGTCSDTSSIITSLAGNARLARGFRMYPNPATGITYVVGAEQAWQGAQVVRVLNVLGREVLSVPALPDAMGHVTLPLVGLPAGTYQVQVPGAGFSQKLVVQ